MAVAGEGRPGVVHGSGAGGGPGGIPIEGGLVGVDGHEAMVAVDDDEVAFAHEVGDAGNADDGRNSQGPRQDGGVGGFAAGGGDERQGGGRVEAGGLRGGEGVGDDDRRGACRRAGRASVREAGEEAAGKVVEVARPLAHIGVVEGGDHVAVGGEDGLHRPGGGLAGGDVRRHLSPQFVVVEDGDVGGEDGPLLLPHPGGYIGHEKGELVLRGGKRGGEASRFGFGLARRRVLHQLAGPFFQHDGPADGDAIRGRDPAVHGSPPSRSSF